LRKNWKLVIYWMSFQEIGVGKDGIQGRRRDPTASLGGTRVGSITAGNRRYQNVNGFETVGEQLGPGRGGFQSTARPGPIGVSAAARPVGPVSTGGLPPKPGTGGVAAASAAAAQDPLIKIISDHLLQYQQNVTILQKIVQAIGTQQDTDELQDQYRTQLDAVNELCRRIEMRLKNLAADLDHLNRQEAARRRAAHTKLLKDFKRLKALQDSLAAEAARRQTRIAEERRKIEVANGLDGTGQTEVVDRREREVMLRAQMQEQKVNQAIIEETEQEMLEINKKLYQVNEIYRDLAELVVDQKEQVEHIEITTEAAHSRAKAGLEQVKKAQESQPVCLIS